VKEEAARSGKSRVKITFRRREMETDRWRPREMIDRLPICGRKQSGLSFALKAGQKTYAIEFKLLIDSPRDEKNKKCKI